MLWLFISSFCNSLEAFAARWSFSGDEASALWRSSPETNYLINPMHPDFARIEIGPGDAHTRSGVPGVTALDLLQTSRLWPANRRKNLETLLVSLNPAAIGHRWANDVTAEPHESVLMQTWSYAPAQLRPHCAYAPTFGEPTRRHRAVLSEDCHLRYLAHLLQ
jgi:hypothetical protein